MDPCRVERDELRAAMHAAMRPGVASAAARDTLVRAVEQGAALVAAPRAGVNVVLQVLGLGWVRVLLGAIRGGS